MTVAEGVAGREVAATIRRLQWGRNLTVAEGAERQRLLNSLGGTSMGPQLDSCGRDPEPGEDGYVDVALQWGRNLTVAEGRKADALAALDHATSMGPQLDSCGRRACARSVWRPSQNFNGAAT